MNTGTRIGATIVSASMAIVATQAMAFAAKDSKTLLEVDTVSVPDELRDRIEAAVAKRDVRLAVSQAFSALASGFGEDETTLAAKYFAGSEHLAQAPGRAIGDKEDFNTLGNACHSACHTACHTACHSACHGSRGWR